MANVGDVEAAVRAGKALVPTLITRLLYMKAKIDVLLSF